MNTASHATNSHCDDNHVKPQAVAVRNLLHSIAADGAGARTRLHAAEGGCVSTAGYICRPGPGMVCTSWAESDYSHSLHCGPSPPRLCTVQVPHLAPFITC